MGFRPGFRSEWVGMRGQSWGWRLEGKAITAFAFNNHPVRHSLSNRISRCVSQSRTKEVFAKGVPQLKKKSLDRGKRGNPSKKRGRASGISAIGRTCRDTRAKVTLGALDEPAGL